MKKKFEEMTITEAETAKRQMEAKLLYHRAQAAEREAADWHGEARVTNRVPYELYEQALIELDATRANLSKTEKELCSATRKLSAIMAITAPGYVAGSLYEKLSTQFEDLRKENKRLNAELCSATRNCAAGETGITGDSPSEHSAFPCGTYSGG